MARFAPIDLSQLPPPTAVETLSFEAIRAALLADLSAIYPSYSALLESDPAVAVLEVAAYRELLIRQRVNDASAAVMLAYATGSDLDNLGALLGTARLSGETDERLRLRIQLAPEAFSTAGSIGAYRYHALTASSAIRDVGVSQPRPGQVLVSLLSYDPDGVVSHETIKAVADRLNAEEIRPLTDVVLVRQAVLLPYDVEAALVLYDGPDATTVEAAARTALAAYAESVFRVGYDVAISGIIGALHQSGVQRVELSTPADDVAISDAQAAYLRNVNVTVRGRGR
jgi:phage-related baseplate assembly protein